MYEFGRSVADRFDMGKSSLSNSFMRVVAKINEVSGDYIKWPQGNDILQLKTAFHKIKGMPGVIGAIDGSDVEVKAPKVSLFHSVFDPSAFIVNLLMRKCVRFFRRIANTTSIERRGTL